MKKICIFSSSSQKIDKIYFKQANELSELLGENNYDLVFGGGTIGLMGECARGFKKYNRYVTSVIPKKLNRKGIIFEQSDEIIETETMNERKFIMNKISDGFITLAGGFGTIEELMEVITLKQLGYHNKPIVILNTKNFYRYLIKQLDVLYNQNFTKEIFKNSYFITKNSDEALDYLNNYAPKEYEEKFY